MPYDAEPRSLQQGAAAGLSETGHLHGVVALNPRPIALAFSICMAVLQTQVKLESHSALPNLLRNTAIDRPSPTNTGGTAKEGSAHHCSIQIDAGGS